MNNLVTLGIMMSVCSIGATIGFAISYYEKKKLKPKKLILGNTDK